MIAEALEPKLQSRLMKKFGSADAEPASFTEQGIYFAGLGVTNSHYLSPNAKRKRHLLRMLDSRHIRPKPFSQKLGKIDGSKTALQGVGIAKCSDGGGRGAAQRELKVRREGREIDSRHGTDENIKGTMLQAATHRMVVPYERCGPLLDRSGSAPKCAAEAHFDPDSEE